MQKSYQQHNQPKQNQKQFQELYKINFQTVLRKQFNNLTTLESNLNINFNSLVDIISKQNNQIIFLKSSFKNIENNQNGFFKFIKQFQQKDKKQNKIIIDSSSPYQRNNNNIKENKSSNIGSLSQQSITCFGGSALKDPQVIQYKQQINKNAFQKINLKQKQKSDSMKNLNLSVNQNKNEEDHIDLTLSRDYNNNSSTQGDGVNKYISQNIQTQMQFSYPSFGQIEANNKKSIEFSQSKIKELELIEKKILEMNERLNTLEINQQKTYQLNFKRFRQINLEVQKYTEAFQKSSGTLKMYQNQVQKLRSQLTEYKLKKQSQLMKMTNNMHNGKGDSSQNDFIVDKIVFLSKSVAQMIKKTRFNQQVQQINIQLENIKKNMKKFVQNQELQASIEMVDRKIRLIQNKKNKKSKLAENQNPQHHQQDLHQGQRQNDQNINNQVTQQLIDKLFSHDKLINQLKNQISELVQSYTQHKTFSKNQFELLNQRQDQIVNKIEKIQYSMKNHEEFLKDMNKTYNSKHFQSQNQIIQMQEAIQKLSNQIKFYQHASKIDNNINGVNNTGQLTSSLQQSNQIRNIDLQNDISNLKKKIGKLTLKVQSVKEDILNVRQDFAVDIQSIKAALEKKADWQSLKQGLGFFQGHIKDLSAMIKNLSIQKQNQSKQEGSLATKKSWTCLCCDKEVKKLGLQGNFSDARFTSILPTRFSSPRIGGYYKQNQTERQYKALYLAKQRKLIKSGSKDPKQEK